MKHYDSSCILTSPVIYHCVICILDQPKYLVDYDRYEKTVNGVIFKVLYHETIIRTTIFLFHKHSDYKHKQGAGGGGSWGKGSWESAILRLMLETNIL